MTRSRIAVSDGNDSRSRSSGDPLSGGGSFVSDGGRMISTIASYGDGIGSMFWFKRNTFIGSYRHLSCARRRYFASP